jgi:hypothetical protein
MIQPVNRKKPDPSQSGIPGFNMAGSESMPSNNAPTGSSAPPSGSAPASTTPSAADAYAAAGSALNGPTPAEQARTEFRTGLAMHQAGNSAGAGEHFDAAGRLDPEHFSVGTPFSGDMGASKGPTPGGLSAGNLGKAMAPPSGPLGAGNLGKPPSAAATAAAPMSAGNLGQAAPMSAGNLAAPGWQRSAGQALQNAAAGGGLASMGRAGAAADMGIRGARAMFKSNPHQNPDSWRNALASPEGASSFMGRGAPAGLYGIQTTKMFAQPGRGNAGATTTSSMRPDEFQNEYQGGNSAYSAAGSGTYHGMASPGSMTPSQGLAPPGAASDWTHASTTSGTGSPFFDLNQQNTNGMKLNPVASIQATPTNN